VGCDDGRVGVATIPDVAAMVEVTIAPCSAGAGQSVELSDEVAAMPAEAHDRRHHFTTSTLT
jgi:hypothetical protein